MYPEKAKEIDWCRECKLICRIPSTGGTIKLKK
jgi:hypothetical protein